MNSINQNTRSSCRSYRFGLIRHALVMLLFLFTATASRAQYCVPTGMSTYGSCTGGSILNVTFGSLNHSAGCIASGSQSSDYYKNLTATVNPTPVVAGTAYNVSVQHSVGWAGGAAVWIDYNQNQIFESGERVIASTSTSMNGTLSGSVTIPPTAIGGVTRMRVIAKESGVPTNPCTPGGWSEVEDYTIIINNNTYNNAGIKAFAPIASFCSGTTVTKDVYVRVVNSGKNQLSNVSVEWQVNGVNQIPFVFNSLLDTINGTSASDTLLNIGSVVFSSSATQVIKAWTAFPNSVADTSNFDDTLSLSVTPSVNGNFTIGDIGADFTTIQQALTSLQNGICGPVVFTFTSASQVYSGPVNISPIPGASGVNTVTFKGTDTAQTIITSSTSSTVNINGASHIIFRDILFRTTNTNGSVLFGLSNADSNSIINCKFVLPVSGSSNYESINAGSCNSLLVDSVSIKGGYAGVTLMGVSGNADVGNVIRNSVFDSLYNGAISCWYQIAVKIQKNTLTTIGNGTNTFVVGILVREGEKGYLIEKNKISGILGGTAIQTVFSTAVDGRSVIANNMIKAGVGTNATLALRAGSDNNDIVYNTVEVNASNNGSGFCLFVNGSGSNNILNNILKNTNQGSIFQVSATNLFLNNNCYYHNNMQNFPYILNGTSHAAFASLKAAGTNDTASIETNPLFISSSNLRTNNPILNNRGYAFSGINTDIDDSTRHLTTPDIGVNEFDLPVREDAGVTGIVLPSVPVSPGALSDVVVVIKNHGVGTLTSTNVTYQSGSTTYTLPYTGSLAEGQSDTVRFLVSANQGLLIPSTGGFAINAWTGFPNGVADNDYSNDTMKRTYCEPLSGTYTINAGGSGARNFVSFNQAVKALACGGVSAPVIFEAAAGTYNERVVIPGIPGASSTRTVTFVSASGLSADVLLTDSSTHDTNNYVIMFAGTNDIYVKNISVSNRGTDYSRAFSYKVTNAVLNERIYVKYCNVSARAATSNTINAALFYAGNEDNKELYIIGNQVSNGSAGINFGGMPLKNQYSNTVVIDSNTFLNNAHNAIVLTYRNGFEINRNNIQSSSAAMVNAISVYEVCGDAGLRQNTINLVQGAGIRFNRYAFYNEAGSAYVINNSVMLSSTADVPQLGLGLISSSKVHVYNNTFKTNSSKTSTFASYTPNYGVYVQAEPVASNLQNVAAFGNRIVNNIIQVENSYPLYVDDVLFGTGTSQLSRLAIAEINNNLYHNTNGTDVAFVISTGYTKANFNAFKDVIRTNSDSISRYVKVPFTAGSLKPLESDSIAWWINGRALHNPLVANDITGNVRATIPYNGVPDIGAYEITPTSLPPVATAVPAIPIAGTTQAFVFLGDTVARIYYDMSGLAPASVQVRQYVGERPPLVSANQKFMYNYVSIEMPSGSYNYNAEMIYNDAWTGTMSNNEADIRMISQDVLGNWTMVNTSVLDMVSNTLSGLYLYASSYVLTGTDPAAPLPVKITSFTARRSGAEQAELTWKTAAERNVSYYTIQRSPDGVNFEAVDNVKANNTPSTYRFTDDVRTGAQVMYYRLLVTDRNGSEALSEVAKVWFDSKASAEITLAPNPVNTSLNIRLGSLIDEEVKVAVYNIQGEMVSEQSYQSVSSISQDATGLKAGLYFVKVAYGDIVKTTRFIKY